MFTKSKLGNTIKTKETSLTFLTLYNKLKVV